jgi:hypothetical protein
VAPGSPGELEPDHRTAEALLHEARAVLYERAVPEIARSAEGRFDRDGFERSIADMRDLFHARTTVERILTERDGAGGVAGRNRLYKQHTRARTRLLSELPAWLVQAALSQRLNMAVRNLACAELAPRVDREDRR